MSTTQLSIVVINNSSLRIFISLYENVVFGDTKGKTCISEIDIVPPRGEKHLLIPDSDSINWNRDFPILETLNERHVKITFEDGEDVMFHAGKLYLIGNGIDKIVVTSDFQVSCGSDPKCDNKIDTPFVDQFVEEYVLNQYTLEKLGIGTPLLGV